MCNTYVHVYAIYVGIKLVFIWNYMHTNNRYKIEKTTSLLTDNVTDTDAKNISKVAFK